MATPAQTTAKPAVESWFERRTFRAADFSDIADLAAAKRRLGLSVSVVLPCREVAQTIGPIAEQVMLLGEAEVVDQAIAVDAASDDGTAQLALAHGLEVHQEEALLPEFGPVLGKGDALWRSLSVARGDIIVFADSDTANFEAHFIARLIGPLLADPAIRFVKGSFHRDAGRVTELTARPLLAAFYPELAAFGQPLAGEVAARRDLLRAIPFCTGYAVESAMLVDVLATAGLDAMAQVDLGTRANPHQPLPALGRMSYEIVQALVARLEREGRGVLERPAADYVHAACLPEGIRLVRDRAEVIERPRMQSVDH
jgi:glucosyl-3-phosphoglycerate synthase